MRVVFSGAEANAHRIEAYQGLDSLYGIARAATLAAHYVATGIVRHRMPFDSSIQWHLTGLEQGSLGAVFQVITQAANAAEVVLRTTRLTSRIVRRGTGQAAAGDLNVGGLQVPSGDVDALAEAAEPGLQRAHGWIDQPNKSIALVENNGSSLILNSTSKEYIETEIEGEIDEIQDVSVAALNVNGRNGRVYFFDIDRTVPFKVSRSANARTIPTLGDFVRQYARRTGATVNIRYTKIFYPDQRLKRIVIHDCFAIEGRA
jgi:hypothetical protein